MTRAAPSAGPVPGDPAATPGERLRRWVERQPAPRRDGALAGAVAAVGLVEIVQVGERAAAPLAWVVVALALALALLGRRDAIVAAALAWTGLAVLQVAVVVSLETASSPFLSYVLLAYAAGRHGSVRGGRIALGVLVAGIELVYLAAASPVVGDYVFPPLIAAGVWGVGRAVRTRQALAVELQEATLIDLEARERAAAAAQAEERRRIAREMHDVVAHSVSVMVVQAGGARRILSRDPARAAAAAAQIEATGREAMREMRQLLGVIEADAGARGPQPSLDGLPALLERSRVAGLAVALTAVGAARPLPAGVELAAYRIVQEALTNALRHAGPVAATVLLRWTPDALELAVANAAPDEGVERPASTPGGHGLLGMRERARLYGGSLDAGPTAPGGWAVRATLPLDPPSKEFPP